MKICIVKLSAMGDIIHAMVVLQFIKKQRADIQIDWIVEDAFKGVLENNPHIDNIISVNLKSIKKKKLEIFNQIKKLRRYKKNNYDLVIDAQGLLKSAIVSKIVAKAQIVGFDKNSIRESIASKFYNKGFDISYALNKIDRNAKLFSKALDMEIQKGDILNKEPFLYYKNKEFEFLAKERKNIIFVVGSSWPSKNYPKEKYLELSKMFDENIIIVWGNEEEKSFAEFIKKGNDKVVVSPKLSLDKLKCLISKVDLVIGNDTGPTHMAWGLNIPSIMLFGPTPVEQAYETKINKVIKSSSEVNPYKLNKNDFSIKEIKITQIYEESQEFL
eukprot:Anaeramoba_flamelloidesa329845_22.p1 GENE.a329845_22~~a329845_22.p1  ORF type:complete len:329 (+),score=17.79 a329845_22:423-1409(+)